MRKTKIVCTIGPSSSSEDVIEAMIESGMTVARLNFSHGNHSDYTEKINIIRDTARKLGTVSQGVLELSILFLTQYERVPYKMSHAY
jgi:pyruvate kinase